MSKLRRTLMPWVFLIAAPALAQAPPATGTPVAPASAAPGGGTSGAVDPNQVVDVDLSSGIFLDPLPFDVPFILRGNAAPEVRAITARIRTFPDFVNCAQRQKEIHSGPSLGLASLVVQNGQPKFLLPVPELQVNKYYCFEFTRSSELADQQTFRDNAFKAVDSALRQPMSEEQSLVAYEDLRKKLIAIVNSQLGPNQVLDVPNDSFFGSGKPDEVKLQTREEFTQILGLQIQRKDALNLLGTAQAQAVNGLTQLVGSDAYRRVVSGLQRGRLTGLSLDEFLKARPGALSLALLSRDDLTFVAFGIDPSSPINPDQIFASADAKALAARLNATDAGLADLQGVVDALNQNQVLRASAGLDDAAGKTALAALPDLVAAARIGLRPARAAAQGFVAALEKREALIQDLTSRLNRLLQAVLPIQATTVGGFQLRASWYISVDVGLATATRIDEVFTYVGANVYLRPVNKAARLRWSGFRRGFWSEFGRRFAFMVGEPYNQLNKAGERSGLIMDRPLVVGAGFRINDLLRVTGGALVFKKNDPNPLVNHQRIGSTPFFSLSVDWDVKTAFLKVFSPATGAPATP